MMHTNLMLVAPCFFIMLTASMALPPVASMGSTTMTSRSLISLGSLQKYSMGLAVSSSRYRPICPTFAAGMRVSIPSTMPSPARKIGTMASLRPESILVLQRQMGVSTVTSLRGRSRVAS